MFKCLVLNNRNKYICFYMLKILLSSNKIVPEKIKTKDEIMYEYLCDNPQQNTN